MICYLEESAAMQTDHQLLLWLINVKFLFSGSNMSAKQMADHELVHHLKSHIILCLKNGLDEAIHNNKWCFFFNFHLIMTVKILSLIMVPKSKIAEILR